MEPNSRCRSNGDSNLFQSYVLPCVKLRHIQQFWAFIILKATNFECLRWPSGVHSVNSICATSSVRTTTTGTSFDKWRNIYQLGRLLIWCSHIERDKAVNHRVNLLRYF